MWRELLSEPAWLISGGVLIGMYVLISSELVHRTTAAIMGAALLLFVSEVIGGFDRRFVLFAPDPERGHENDFLKAVSYIDLNVILLLMAMMMIVAVLEDTGIFQWLAARLYQWSRGSISALAIMLAVFTAAVSSLLDNVTTMVLLTPIIVEICRALDVRVWSILLPAVLASNIGGAATLIGDPPNILIGSYAGLDFNAFLVNLGPFVILTPLCHRVPGAALRGGMAALEVKAG